MKEVVIGFLMSYWIDIIVVVVVALALLILYSLKKRPLVKKILYSLVCYAEKKYGSGTGEIKYGTVLSMFYSRMPFIVRLAFPESLLSKLIEDAVVRLKIELSEGLTLTGYDEELIEAKCEEAEVVGGNEND
jgi:hypothetical protein